MMGLHQPQEALFSYRINLDHRLRPDPPLRRVAQVIDFTFVRAEVAQFYGPNGNEGVGPNARTPKRAGVAARAENVVAVRARMARLRFTGCRMPAK